MAPDDHKRLDEYKQRFHNAPVGCWHSATGSFNNVMGQVWHFFPDGTGKYTEYGPFGAVYCKTRFEWREKAAWQIEYREIETIRNTPAENEDTADPDEETAVEVMWEIIRYDFQLIEHDLGREPALVEPDFPAGIFKSHKAGFRGMDPLAYLGAP